MESYIEQFEATADGLELIVTLNNGKDTQRVAVTRDTKENCRAAMRDFLDYLGRCGVLIDMPDAGMLPRA